MSTNTLYLGYHVSSAGGYMAMGKRAAALGANTFAFFTRNPRGGAAARVEEGDAAEETTEQELHQTTATEQNECEQ